MEFMITVKHVPWPVIKANLASLAQCCSKLLQEDVICEEYLANVDKVAGIPELNIALLGKRHGWRGAGGLGWKMEVWTGKECGGVDRAVGDGTRGLPLEGSREETNALTP